MQNNYNSSNQTRKKQRTICLHLQLLLRINIKEKTFIIYKKEEGNIIFIIIITVTGC